MRFKVLFICLMLSSVFPSNAQKSDAQQLTNTHIWNLLLHDVKFKYVYSVKYDALIPKPKFGRKLKKLDGETITIQGFFLPVNLTGNIFVLSYNPMSSCFYCSKGGIETVIELNVSPDHIDRFRRIKTDTYFEIKGKLRLNKDTTEHLIYIMDDVEYVRTVKK